MIQKHTSVHVEKQKTVLGASASSFSKVPVATPLVSPTAASQAEAFQAAACLPTANGISPRQATKSCERSYADGGKESCVSGFNL